MSKKWSTIQLFMGINMVKYSVKYEYKNGKIFSYSWV